ncbi:MAG: TolC family protein [Bacteroidales bacterium]|jgi:cobalt-zinc-cadmium efflux system outer membrane protein|nr:TolC family protein [Bacteroidales bacterium]
MRIIKIALLCILILLCKHKTLAQSALEITDEQAEKQFLEKNLQILAERCNISIADAAVVQAKVLNNPTISVGDINFWNPNASTEVGVPASFGNNFIFSVELEKIIKTAGKRKRLVNLEKMSKEIALQEFETFLLNLKTELRIILHETVYLQSYLNIVNKQLEIMDNLVQVYKNQTVLGNVAKRELIRIQASLIELESEANEIRTELNKLYKTIKILLNYAPEEKIWILPASVVLKNPDEISLPNLLDMAKNSRPEYLLSDLNVKYHEKLLLYEKTLRSPDIALSVNYDRYGGVWKNFVGLGISLDIPVFNKNQGNIKMAKHFLEQSNYYAEEQKNAIQQEVVEIYNDYKMNYLFYNKLMENDFSEDLDNMLDVHSRNFMNKNINMLEYIDFMYAYKTTKQAMLLAKKNLDIRFTELQFSINNEIN